MEFRIMALSMLALGAAPLSAQISQANIERSVQLRESWMYLTENVA